MAAALALEKPPQENFSRSRRARRRLRRASPERVKENRPRLRLRASSAPVFANGAVTGAFSYAFGEAARRASGPPGRALTANEIAEAQGVFGDRIDYSQARIIDGKYVFTQGSGYVMSPDGSIYWPGGCSDLATCGGGASAGTFIHEMTHVMQYQHGVNVLGQGLLLQAGKFLSFGLYNPYSFSYDPSRAFSSYNIEQQGDIARGIYYGRYPNNIDY